MIEGQKEGTFMKTSKPCWGWRGRLEVKQTEIDRAQYMTRDRERERERERERPRDRETDGERVREA